MRFIRTYCDIRCFLMCMLMSGTGVAFAQQPIGTVQAQNVTVRGAVTLTGKSAELRSGAQISTADQPATINLARGGILRICPRSSLQITASPSGKELLIALDAGAVETNYLLSGSADTIMTTDFQLQLTGPGVFHYTIGAQQTRLCAHALAGTNASLIVAETLGSGTYQVRPGDRTAFKDGSVANADAQDASICGCPESVVQAAPPQLGFPEQQSQAAAQAIASGSAPPVAPPISGVPETTAQPNETITQVSVPLAFKGAEEEVPPLPAPPPVADVELPKLPEVAKPVVQPPPKRRSTNWLKRFFSKIFH
jgi:hypothetical protein